MSAHFAQAKECQVFERDLHDILLFPHITLSTLQSALLTTITDDDKNHHNSNEGLNAKLAAIYTLAQNALTESSLREQVTNGLVKVAVPRFRREALIDHNVFVQRILAQHNEEQMKKQEEESESKQKLHNKHYMEAQRTHSGNNNVKNINQKSNESDRSSTSAPYRVGRIVAILPKPGSEQNESTSKLADSSSSTGDTNNNNYEDSLSTLLSSVYNSTSKKTALYNKWLIAVHFGEAVEVLNLKTIVNDQFTEEEFQVYTQSSLATSLNASFQGKLSSAGPNVLLSSEQAEGLRAKLHTLRAAFQLLHNVCQVQENQLPAVNTMNGKVRGEVTVQNEKVNKAASTIVEHHSEEESTLSSQYKRSRMELLEEEENSARNEEKKKCVSSSNNDNYNAQLTITALHSREREMVEQIHKLRELIVIRDNELAHSLQTQRQMEKTHQSELAQWRTKLDEEAQGRQRMQRELSSSMKDKTALLDEANVKLRRLAEMTMKYKRIVDEVKRQIGEAVKHGDGYTVKQVNLDTPEAILAQLKQATLHTSN